MNTWKITLQEDRKYPISQELFGIFLEDINFACDGGLNANRVNNYSFDGVYQDTACRSEKADYLRYWHVENGQLVSACEDPLSENSRYAILRTAGGKAVVTNKGYNGGKAYGQVGAIPVTGGQDYVFSTYVRNTNFNGKIFVSIAGDDRLPRTERKEFSLHSRRWEQIQIEIKGTSSGYGVLKIEAEGTGEFHLDCVEFREKSVWGENDPKWRYGKLRKDLVEAIAVLKPKFMRFPGGCVVEGENGGNEYNWKDTVGELYERKSKYNIWSERMPDGGYNQSYQIGFYEYFCLCEDLGMKPLPTLWAGFNCQIRAMCREEAAPEIPLEDPRFQTEVIDSYLDLIDFANGTDSGSKWAALRMKMGHPEPFGLDRIGVGNENWGEGYLKKFGAIERAVHEKYPEMQLVISCHHSSDIQVLAPIWDYIKKHHPNVIVDEHAYMEPEWFVRQEHRYDGYQRGTAKVYVGEYAANNIPSPGVANNENGNYFQSALAEAVFLCGLERNGDVVAMSSYAPLLNLAGCHQWRHNLIDFNPETVCLTANYLVQRAFSSADGCCYIPTVQDTLDSTVVSCVENRQGVRYLRVVNLRQEALSVEVSTGRTLSQVRCETIASPEGLYVKNRLGFYGKPDYRICSTFREAEVQGSCFSLTLPPQSVNVLAITQEGKEGECHV